MTPIVLEIGRSRGDTAEEVLESIIAEYRTRSFDSGGRVAQELAAVVVAELRRPDRWNGEAVYVMTGPDRRNLEVTNNASRRLWLLEHGWDIAGASPWDPWQ